ncbi:MAG: peptidoglycan DD-metalloendopeptidase family protein [Cyanobacteria bacterium SID2]|nr:peptidoglycan DD-metalloendopeptidase family protein [Cyanobacteria bacterium SID2]MBP0005100.1 peptidoglycan DD-metalloendopeptidase family protein [Cyanobacteria bacterium SBC]
MPESYRRVRNSAAAIGIAISMGASGVLLPKQGDAAMAAEPSTAKTAATLMPPSIDKTAVLPVEEAPKSEKVAKTPDSSSPQLELADSDFVTHLVQSGQTLWKIAQAYGVDANLIADANAISVDAVLEIGQVLSVPVTEGMVYPPLDLVSPESDTTLLMPDSEKVADKIPVREASRSESRLALAPTSQNLDSKYTLAAIEQNDRTMPVDRLALAKKPRPSGDLLQADATASELPDRLEARPDPSSEQTLTNLDLSLSIESDRSTEAHRVREGETLVQVARLHGVSVEDLVRENQIGNPNNIFAGQELAIPTPVAQSESLTVFGNPTSAVPFPNDKLQVIREGESSDRALPNVVLLENPPAEVDVPNLVPLAPIDDVETAEVPVLGTDEMASEDDAPQLQAFQSSADESTYAEELQADIDRLRDRYRNSESTPRSQVDLSTDSIAHVDSSERTLGNLSAGSRVNPEFNPDSETTEELVKPKPESQEVAVAPVGSANYAPIVPPISVSPELPALSSPGAYLPKPAAPAGGLGTGNMEFNGYIWPAQGVLSSGFGWRWGRMHNGIDIAGPVGTPIVAAAPGTVTYARWNDGGYGNLVEVTHPDGSLTLYAHNNRILVSEGQQVNQGQQIAEMGNTGYSTGPHLHFEIHPSGHGAVDPLAYLP